MSEWGAIALIGMLGALGALLPWERSTLPKRLERWVPIALLLVGFSVFAYLVYLGCLRHYAFGSRDFDLGVITNVVANSAQGELLRSSYYRGASFLGIHVTPMYLVWAIPYAMFPRPETLIVIQGIGLGAGAYVLYRFAKALGLPCSALAMLVLAFVLHPASHGAALYDVHEISFLPAVLFLGALGIVLNRRGLVWIAFLGAVMVKEDAVLFLAAQSVALRFAVRRDGSLVQAAPLPLPGLLLSCGAWYVATVLIREAMGDNAHPFVWYYQDLILPGYQGLTGLLLSVMQNPLPLVMRLLSLERLQYVLILGLPLGLLCYSRPRWWPLFLLGFAITLPASEKKFELYQISFQYVWYILPGLFIATALAMRTAGPRSLGGVFVATIAATFLFGGLGPGPFFKAGYRMPSFEATSAQEEMERFLISLPRSIPSDSWIACDGKVCAHVYPFLNVLPCRAFVPEQDQNITYALFLDDPRCAPERLAAWGFVERDSAGALKLLERTSPPPPASEKEPIIQ